MSTAPGRDRGGRPGRPARGQAADRGRTGAGGRTETDRRRRVLSQNYLRGPEAARQFLTAVRPDPDGLCLEVGAGEGVLTVRLAAMFAEVVAYEIDQNLAARLKAKVAGRPNVRVQLIDFLAARQPARPFQVVGNAPFSLTSPIIEWCLRASRLTAATLITQREYARKRTGGYGRWTQLTVTTWPQVSWQLLGTIPRTDFRPVPRVDAAILRLERRAEPLISPARQAAYRRLVQTGFSGVGGSVRASLRRSYPADQVAEACGGAGVDRHAVVAFVSPDQWIQIFQALDASSRQHTRPSRSGRT
ncbi:MAG: ErmE/ErmH/ErmO/ErmR family 23S rRNA (adenine(2058)-N(6))-methyltransferase [Actinobacteria bacterium]|nr:ErmE/ErmH/ErmO/ErmR family 23S rRNA (adenine(2058)-N(6))-methyltransferase [Actinomycetota bacterium]